MPPKFKQMKRLQKLVRPLDQIGVFCLATLSEPAAAPERAAGPPCPSRVSSPAGCTGRSPTRSARSSAPGEYTAGQRLPPERDLARQLGVSRPSVREALIALEVEGLVEVRIGSGIYVLGGANGDDGDQVQAASRAVRAAARALDHRRRMRGAGGQVGEEEHIAAIEEALEQMQRIMETDKVQPLACRSAVPPARRRGDRQRRAGGGAENALGRADGSAVRAARASLRHAGAVGRRRSPSIATC